MTRELTIGLIGAGMFGGDVHLRTYAQLQRNGLAPWLGRLGLDDVARPLADVQVRVVAVATNTKKSAETHKERFAPMGLDFATYHGDTPWLDVLRDFPDLDVMAVATPDHMHAAPMLAGLEAGAHVIVEKPMVLDTTEADAIIAAGKKAQRIVAVDMHKRYDSDHLFIRDVLRERIGQPLYGRAVLEEPLDISTKVFRKWAEHSDPFTYVGSHWTDLIVAYFGVKPVSLHAVGQKEKLRSEYDMDAYDAVQVKVQFDNGMSVDFVNNWIMPNEFEAHVNQESQLCGTRGAVESDSQYRGLRFTVEGDRTRTANNHFTRDVLREDGTQAYVGYGADSLIACLTKAAEVKFLGKTPADLKGTYPDAEESRHSVMIIHAAREVLRRNTSYMGEGKGAPVTAGISERTIEVYDPFAGTERIYPQSG